MSVSTGWKAHRIVGLAIGLGAALYGGVQAEAASAIWSKLSPAGTYYWTNSLNWNPSSTFPNNAGEIASMGSVNYAGTLVVNLNQPITVGGLTIGDSGSSYYGMTVAPGPGGGTLTFDNSGSTVSVSKSAGQAHDVVSAPITLSDNTTINNSQNNTGRTLTLSGGIGESAAGKSVTVTGGGLSALVIYTGANTYSGGTTVNSGVLRLNNVNALPAAGALTLAGTGVVELQNPNAITQPLGSGSGNVQLTGGVVGFSALGATGTININNDGSTLQWGGASFDPTELVLNGTQASQTLNFLNGLDLNGATRTITTIANTATASGSIVNTGGGTPGLVKKGAGALNLTGTSSFTGPSTVLAGTLRFNSIANADGTASALGAPATVADGTIMVGATTTAGILRYDGAGHTSDRVIDMAGTTGGLTLQGYGAGALILSSDMTASGSGAKTLTLGGTSTLANEVQGAIVDSAGGATALTKADTGKWILSGNSTFTGKTTISSGTLGINAIGNVGGGASPLGAPVTVANGTIASQATLLYLGPGHTTDRAIDLYDDTTGPTLDSSGSGALVFTSAFTATGIGSKTLTLGGTNLTDNTIAANVVDNGGANLTRVSKTGTGRWVLSGTRTYSGTTSLSAGTLVIDSVANADGTASAIGAPTTVANGTIALGAATLLYTGAGHTSDRVINLTGSGRIEASGSGPLVFTANNTSASGDKTFYLSGTNTDANAIMGRIVNYNSSDTTKINKSGPGTWALGGNNTFTDTVTINDGILRMASGTALNTNAPVQVLFGASVPAGTKLQLDGYSVTAKNLTSGTPAGSPVVENGHAATESTLTLLQSGATTFEGVFQDGGAAKLHLNKTGGNALILTGDSTLSGTTTIGANVLQLGNGGTAGSLGTGDITNNATLTVNRSNTYQMNNTIAGSGALTKSGAGTLVLTADNSYAGLSTVSAGSLRIEHANALGATSGATTVASGATLSLAGGITVADEALTINGVGVGSGGALHNAAGTNTYAGAITMVANSTIGSDADQLRLASVSKDASDRSLTLTGAGDGIVEGPITLGAGGDLTKSGSGTWLLTGANYIDSTTVNNGVLQAGDGGTTGNFGDNTITVNAPGILRSKRSDDYIISVTVAGTGGSLEQDGTGRLILTSTDTLAGPVLINSGILQLGNNSTYGSFSAVTVITNNATLEFYRSTDTSGAYPIVGSGSLIKNGAAKVTLTGNSEYAGTTTINSGTLDVGGGGANGTLGLGEVIDNGTLTFNRSADWVNRNLISGSGAVSKLGTGTLTFTNANTYAGNTTIGSGVLRITHPQALGLTSGYTAANPGSLELSDVGTISEPLRVYSGVLLGKDGTNTVDTTVMIYGTATIGVTDGKLVLANPAAILRDSPNNRDITLAGAGEGVVDGSIALGSGKLTKSGAGLWNLNGAGEFSGSTTPLTGTLRLGNPLAIYKSQLNYTNSNSGAVSFGTLAAATFGGIYGDKDLVLENELAEPVNLSLGYSSGGDFRYQGVMSGSGSLTKIGSKILTLLNDQTYAGTTTIASGGGRVMVGYSTAEGSLGCGDVTVAGGTTLEYRRTDIYTLTNNLVCAGTFANTGTNLMVLTGNNVITGGTKVQANSAYGFAGHPVLQIGMGGTEGGASIGAVDLGTTANTGGSGGAGLDNEFGHLVINRSDDFSITGTVVGQGSFRHAGAGRVLLLAGSNAWKGYTYIDQGILLIANNTSNGWIPTNTVFNNGTIDFRRSAAAGNPPLANYFTGTGTFVQSGYSPITLVGNLNDYTGGTIVSNSALVVNNGSGLGTGPGVVQIHSGGTLCGTGRVSNVSVNAGGAISAGGTASVGTLTTSNVTMNAGAALTVKLATPAASDRVQVVGAAVLNGVVNVEDIGDVKPVEGSYLVMTSTGAMTDNGLTLGTVTTGFGAKLTVDTTAREVWLNVKRNSTMFILY